MPWVHGEDYMLQKNAELKHLLLLRRLPYSGTKEKMTSRLISHDQHHPFPFQRLPPELRNTIYLLVASQDAPISSNSKKPVIGHTEGFQSFRRFEAENVASSLFRACRQTRREGLFLFYLHHHFELAVEHGGCFLAIQTWLQNMGYYARNSIRNLSISYIGKCSTYDMLHIDQIHEKLSDQATVAYSSYDHPELLWQIGERYEMQTRGEAPIFRLGRNGRVTTYMYRCNFRNIERKWGRLQYSIVFYPGKSWFGRRMFSRP